MLSKCKMFRIQYSTTRLKLSFSIQSLIRRIGGRSSTYVYSNCLSCVFSHVIFIVKTKFPNLGVNFFVIFQEVLWLHTSFYMLLESLGLDIRCSIHAHSFRFVATSSVWASGASQQSMVMKSRWTFFCLHNSIRQ